MRILVVKTAYALIVLCGIVYAFVELRGPNGIPGLLEKRRLVHEYEQSNEQLHREIEQKQERILRLEKDPRELDIEILGHQRCIDVATASRNELQDLIATLSRKPRARKPSAAKSAGPAEDTSRPTVEAAPLPPADVTPRPSVFGALPLAANDEAGDQVGEAA